MFGSHGLDSSQWKQGNVVALSAQIRWAQTRSRYTKPISWNISNLRVTEILLENVGVLTKGNPKTEKSLGLKADLNYRPWRTWVATLAKVHANECLLPLI